MADNREELNKLRRAKRAKQRARAKRQRLMGRLLIAAMVLTLAVVCILMLKPEEENRPTAPTQGDISLEETTLPQEESQPATKPQEAARVRMTPVTMPPIKPRMPLFIRAPFCPLRVQSTDHPGRRA